MEREYLLQLVQKEISPERYQHTLRVETIALEFAPRFRVAAPALSQAAILHDWCRETAPDLLLKLAGDFGIVIDDLEQAEPLLLHAAVAAAQAGRLGISDYEVLEAIANHITGGAGICRMAQLLFIADSIEPGRDYPAARMLRETARTMTLEEMLLAVYNQTVVYLMQNNYPLHPRTVAGRNELIMKGIILHEKTISHCLGGSPAEKGGKSANA
jgi:predicted HD superfamily hydrolase involved in NAD metabolism